MMGSPTQRQRGQSPTILRSVVRLTRKWGPSSTVAASPIRARLSHRLSAGFRFTRLGGRYRSKRKLGKLLRLVRKFARRGEVFLRKIGPAIADMGGQTSEGVCKLLILALFP